MQQLRNLLQQMRMTGFEHHQLPFVQGFYKHTYPLGRDDLVKLAEKHCNRHLVVVEESHNLADVEVEFAEADPTAVYPQALLGAVHLEAGEADQTFVNHVIPVQHIQKSEEGLWLKHGALEELLQPTRVGGNIVPEASLDAVRRDQEKLVDALWEAFHQCQCEFSPHAKAHQREVIYLFLLEKQTNQLLQKILVERHVLFVQTALTMEKQVEGVDGIVTAERMAHRLVIAAALPIAMESQ